MQQQTLFDAAAAEPLDLPGAQVTLLRKWLSAEASLSLYHLLAQSLPWNQPQIVMAGRSIPIPRLQAWVGDADAHYRYSGRGFRPLPWPPELWELKQQLEPVCRSEFNSVLANFYRDGRDSVAYHADDERELGDRPVIASLSLGQPRRFLLRCKANSGVTHPGCALELGDGDLLIMAGDTQKNWQHSLPKTQKACGGRINLTYRRVIRADVAHKRGR